MFYKETMKKLILFIFVILCIPLVLAEMPESHDYIVRGALDIAGDTPVGRIVDKYYEDVIACNILTDFSVFFYFSEGFDAIGREYRATHSKNLCIRMVELSENDADLACAYGVCTHHIADDDIHSTFIPDIITMTGVPNGMIHIFIEEKINDVLVTEESRRRVRTAITNKAPVHKELFRKAVIQERGYSNINFDEMYDEFVVQVTGNKKYSVGFKGFSAIPSNVHIAILAVLALSFTTMIFLFRKKDRNIWGTILMWLSIAMILFIIVIYITFFTGTLWLAFQTISTPVTYITPAPGWEQLIENSIQKTADFFDRGVSYFSYEVKDPSGAEDLLNADKNSAFVRWIAIIIILATILVLLYQSFKKKNTKLFFGKF